jgi:hypothetical protein
VFFKSTYSLATEADTLLGVEDGSLPNKRLDATGTTVDLVKGNLANDLVAVLSVDVMSMAVGRPWARQARTCGAS